MVAPDSASPALTTLQTLSLHDPDDRIRLCLRVSSDEVRCEVSDVGSWRDPVPDPRGLSGWGLQLVDRLSDRWGVIRNDETTVWFEIER